MSLAGGSYLGLSDGEAADPGGKTDLPRVAMPNILDQCYVQKNPNRSPKKWPSTNGKISNGKKEGNSMDESGNNKLPEPCNILYKKKLDFTIPPNKTIGCGLINIGNTCYINSTLQCLLYLPPWYNYVTKEHQQECSISGVDCVVCMFHRFLRGALNYHGSPFAPREIVDKLKYFCTNMVRGRQEDAHEFLVSFVDRMQMSLLRSVPNRLVDASSQYTTAVYKVFGIVVRSQVRCKTCGWRSNNYEFGLNLILGIKNARSLITAFKLYTKKELMDGANAYSCDRCRQRQPAEKHLTVDKAPNVLIIQLLRYDQNEYGNTKLTQHIEFNESLDLNPFMSETEMQSNHHVYQLHGVLVHTGMTIQSGHYFAYVRGMDRKWYKMNDERVHEVSFEEVMSTQAYILFYVRKLKEPQQKPPASIPMLVKHKPNFNPSLASNANYISHKPVVVCPVNSNGNNTRTVVSTTSKPQSASTNGGTPKPSVNGSGVASNGANSNSSNCATSFVASSSIPNRGMKELSSNQREKVAFKISRPKDRWNGANGNGSKPSTPVAESKTSGSASSHPLVTGKTKKLVAYDDESSDQDSDNGGVEPVRDVGLLEKSDPCRACDVSIEVESSADEMNKATSGIDLTETTNTASSRQTPSVALDLEMFSSKRVAGERAPLKRSTSDSNLSARIPSVRAAPTVARNTDRRLSSGDGTLEYGNGKQHFTKTFELHAKPLLYDETNVLVALDIAPPAVNLTNDPPSSLQISNDEELAHSADPPETRIKDNASLSDNGIVLQETNVNCNLSSADIVVVASVATPCVMAMDASPSLACHSKKRRKSGEDDSASCKRSHRSNVGASADDSVEYVWVEKTFESLRHDDIGDHQNGTHSLENSTTGEKPDCCSEKQLKRSKAHNRDRHTKHRSRSVESQTHRNARSSSSSSRPPGGHRSHSNRHDQNNQEDLELRSKFPVRSKQNGRRRRSRSSDRHRSFDRDISQDDRKRRSRSSHRSSKRNDRRHGSRSSRRSRKRRSRSSRRCSVDRDGERRRSRSTRRKHSSTRERRRSRSSLGGRRDSDVRSSKSYDYHVVRNVNRRHCRESSR